MMASSPAECASSPKGAPEDAPRLTRRRTAAVAAATASMTVGSPPRTPVAAALASPVMTPSAGPTPKRTKRSQLTPVTLPTAQTVPSSPPPSATPPVNHAFEQWLDDVSNVDICLSVSMGAPADNSQLFEETEGQEKQEDEPSNHPVIATEFSVSIPAMLSRVLQTKLAIDPARLETVVKKPTTNISPTSCSDEVFVSVAVRGRDEPIAEAIEGGLTPRKAFLRTAPHISRVASRLQECMRQIFGMRDFVVKIDA